MTTTDTDALTEQIERILAEHPILPPTYAGDDPIARKRKRTAARIAEAVSAEVRAASEKAWDDCADVAGDDMGIGGVPHAEELARCNPYRTTETGDRR